MNQRYRKVRTPEEIMDQLLQQRGIEGSEEIEEFLSPRPKRAYDPFLLHNMEEAVELILDEIDAGTRICIYGDYDADGVTSVCILQTLLRELTDNVCHYIPSRFTDGYGLNKDAIRRIHRQGCGLLITVDCGSVSYEEVEYAKSLGMRVIVTDHHTIGPVKADCILINPKQQECSYPFKELAGCGVAFKLAQALRFRCGLPRSVLNDCLDLVAIGTVADIVSLRDENRTMVKYGLLKINQGVRLSLRKLKQEISLHTVTSETIAFGIGPHVNAAGRMGSAEEAVKLFLAEDEDTADRQARILIESNIRRKTLQDRSFRDCLEMPDSNEDFIVILREDVHEGVAGIVAGKLKEERNRPCVLITPTKDGRLKGTGRSIETIDLYDFLKEFGELFDTFGGHRGACGFTLQRGRLEELRAGIRRKIRRIASEEPGIFDRPRVYDMELVPGEITLELCRKLRELEPCGQGNPVPVFAIKSIMLTNLRLMGSEGQHARFRGIDGTGQGVDCVLFRRAAELREALESGGPVSVTGRLDTNTWNGHTTVQFIVEDIDI